MWLRFAFGWQLFCFVWHCARFTDVESYTFCHFRRNFLRRRQFLCAFFNWIACNCIGENDWGQTINEEADVCRCFVPFFVCVCSVGRSWPMIGLHFMQIGFKESKAKHSVRNLMKPGMKHNSIWWLAPALLAKWAQCDSIAWIAIILPQLCIRRFVQATF